MTELDSSVPYGYCHCGCGEKTTIAANTDNTVGAIRGEPRRYIRGHVSKNNGPDYVEENRGFVSACWIWQKCLTSLDYGYAWDSESRKKVMAHRLYYERVYGRIPPGVVLDHLCRVSRCVNPAHLEAVSHRENIRRGAHAKLTPKLANEIRERYRSGGITYKELAADYGLHPVYVGRVVRGLAWAD